MGIGLVVMVKGGRDYMVFCEWSCMGVGIMRLLLSDGDFDRHCVLGSLMALLGAFTRPGDILVGGREMGKRGILSDSE